MNMLNKKINNASLMTIAVVLVLGFVVVVTAIQYQPTLLAAQNKTQDIVAGKLLYQQNCASCHGVNLEGQPNWRKANANGSYPAPPHDETGHTWHHDDNTLFNYIKLGGQGIAQLSGYENPNSGMPAYQTRLNDDEIVAILHYIKSTWPKKIRDIQAARSTK